MPLPGDTPDVSAFLPPTPPARTLRPATLAVGHFHSVLSRGAAWWGEKRLRAVERATAATATATAAGGTGDSPSVGGKGLLGVGERAGRGSSVWALARSTAGAGLEEGGTRKRDRGVGLSAGGKAGGSFSSVIGGGGPGAAGAAGAAGVSSSVLSSLDEFHASPRLRFQLLLREQGVIVTLFDAMETVRFLVLRNDCVCVCVCLVYFFVHFKTNIVACKKKRALRRVEWGSSSAGDTRPWFFVWRVLRAWKTSGIPSKRPRPPRSVFPTRYFAPRIVFLREIFGGTTPRARLFLLGHRHSTAVETGQGAVAMLPGKAEEIGRTRATACASLSGRRWRSRTFSRRTTLEERYSGK